MTTERFVLKDGNYSVTVSDGTARAVEQLVRNLAADVLDPMENAARKQVAAARRRWPDKGRKVSPRATGQSKDAFEIVTSVQVQTGILRVTIRNTARRDGFPYAGAIQSLAAGRVGAGKPRKKPWNEFVTKPMRKRAEAIADEVSEAIAATLRGQ